MSEIAAEQHDYWNGAGSEMWVTRQKQMDASLAPVSAALLAHAAPQQGEHVLDIGCGTGDTTLALATAVGTGGHVTGLDISAPMLGLARTRAESVPNISLILADATTHAFAPARADLLFSRFGVMFFADPVAAFANMRAAMRPAGRLAFACWQPAAANPWVRIPQQAIAPFVPPQPQPDPGLPGQFAFGDANRVSRILTAAGFSPPVFLPVEIPMPIGRDLDDAVERTSQFGATGRALADLAGAQKAAAVAALRAALAPHAAPDVPLTLPGTIWLVRATPG